MDMPALARIFGVLLTLLAPAAIALAGGVTSPTLFIPAIPGVLLFFLGQWAKSQPAKRSLAMHLAAGVALLFMLAGLGRGIPTWIKILGGEQPSSWLAPVMVLIMTGLTAVFLGLCVQSFAKAAKARRLAQNENR